MTKVITMNGRMPDGTRPLGVRDRRFTMRFPFAADAELVDLESGLQIEGVTSDLSLGGCFVCTSKTLPADSRARLVLRRKTEVFRALVIVRISKARVGLGLEFLDLKPPNNDLLAAWIDSLQRKR